MASRKEVFQAKVLKKLYPPTPASTTTTQPVAEQSSAKVPSCTRRGGGRSLPQRRVYTALPCPENFERGEQLTLQTLEDANGEAEPADCESDHQEPEAEGQPKRKRRRKRKPGGEGAAKIGLTDQATHPGFDRRLTGPATYAPLSKNKRRKLKKKRHKEKLLSLGLTHSASAIEFTYQPADPEEEEEEKDTDQTNALLQEFFHATQELCEGSSLPGKPLGSPPATKTLLEHLSQNTLPLAELTRLRHFRKLVKLRHGTRLAEELEEFQQSSTLPSEETSVICSLFRYWVTDLLPMEEQNASS